MTIELIDLDTGATMEVHGDKTSGLQFEGKPTERAWSADEVHHKVMLHLQGDYDLEEYDWWVIQKALELMAKEKTND